MRESQLLVFGELDFEAAHLARLETLGCRVKQLGADAAPQEVRQALAASRFVIFNNVDINPYLESLRTVDLAVLAATGYDFIDTRRADELGLRLAYLPDYSTASVVEYMIWAAIAALRPLHEGPRRVREGNWTKGEKGKKGKKGEKGEKGEKGKKGEKGEKGEKGPLCGREMFGLTAGVVGYGCIGQRLVAKLEALDLRVWVTDRQQVGRAPPALGCAPIEPGGRSPPYHLSGRLLGLPDLVARSDLVFVCCSLNPSSVRLIDADCLARMKPDAVLISISPNEVIDLEALAAALQRRPAARAVLDLDPIPASHPLLRCENAAITPHVAFLTSGALERRRERCVEAIAAFLAGGTVHYITGW